MAKPQPSNAENVEMGQKRASASLEGILLCSSGAFNKQINWRKLWTPYRRNGTFSGKRSQEGNGEDLSGSKRQDEKPAPQKSATKFYDELEIRYFRSGKSPQHDKENPARQCSHPTRGRCGSERDPSELEGSDVDKSEESAVKRQAEELDFQGESERRCTKSTFPRQLEPKQRVSTVGTEKKEEQNEIENDIDPQESENVPENVILSTYQNTIKNVRRTHSQRPGSRKLKAELEAVQEDPCPCPRECQSQKECPGSEPQELLDESDGVVLASGKKPEEEPAESVPETGLAAQLVDKMQKYEQEMQELKSILCKTYEYVAQLQSEISGSTSKRSQPSSLPCSTLPTIVQRVLPSSRDHDFPSQEQTVHEDSDVSLRSDPEKRQSRSEAVPVYVQTVDRDMGRNGRRKRRQRRYQKQLQQVRKRLQQQRFKCKVQRQLLSALQREVEQLKREPKTGESIPTASQTHIASNASEPLPASPFQPASTIASVQPSVTTRPDSGMIANTQRAGKESSMQKPVQESHDAESAENEQSQSQMEYKAHLLSLNTKLTLQLEDNMRTMAELYRSQEQKTKELDVKTAEIAKKSQQIIELRGKLEGVSTTLQLLSSRFQQLENPVRGSTLLEQLHSQTMSNTELCPLSITSLSPTLDASHLTLEYASRKSTPAQKLIFSAKQS